MAEHSTAVGVFETHQQAEQAIHALEHAGFRDDQIGFIMRGSKHEGGGGVISGIVGGVMGAADAVLLPGLGPSEASMALESALPLTEEAIGKFQQRHPQPSKEQPEGQEAQGTQETQETQGKTVQRDEMRSAAQESTENTEDVGKTGNRENVEGTTIPVTEVASGAGEGAVSGGIVGGLVGAAAALLIPGIGPALAGGILVTALGGAAIGAVTGGFLGAFTDMGIPREEAHHYQRELEAGHVLVVVQAEGRLQEALDILRTNGAVTVR